MTVDDSTAVTCGSSALAPGPDGMSTRRTSVMDRRASVMGIADMNDFARTTVVEGTLKSNGGSCEYWKLQDSADAFQCDNLVQAMRSMKKDKTISYTPMM